MNYDMFSEDIPCQYQPSSSVLMGNCLRLAVSFLCLVGHEHQYLICHRIITGAEKVIKIWNPENGEFIRDLSGHTQGLSDIAWSSDSVFLASASDDTTIRIWNVELVRNPSFHPRVPDSSSLSPRD